MSSILEGGIGQEIQEELRQRDQSRVYDRATLWACRRRIRANHGVEGAQSKPHPVTGFPCTASLPVWEDAEDPAGLKARLGVIRLPRISGS